ncbi:hypothetical protein GCM10020219_029620 [Nonomuraea dietziae]
MIVAVGLKVRAAEADSVVKVDPSVLPWTVSVCVRLCQLDGSLSTTSLTLTTEPRSIWIHWGKALLALSQ